MYQNKVICESIQRMMSDDSMPELTSVENDHLATCDACAEALITRTLQQTPEVAIPADFSARVRSQLAVSVETPGAYPRIPAYGFATAIAVLMLLALAWGVFAYFDPHWWVIEGRLSLVLEYLVLFEISAIALWLGMPRSIAG